MFRHPRQPASREARYYFVLTVLLGVFLFRVVAQVLQAVSPVRFLPDFSTWDSGILPYPALLFTQVIVVLFGLLNLYGLRHGEFRPIPALGRVYLWTGSIYFSTMFLRLIAGIGGVSESVWVNAALPTLFHLILAVFLVVLGLYHCQATQRYVAKVAYPLTTVLALTGHVVLIQTDWPIFVAGLVPVTLSAIAIEVLERYYTYRTAWQPNRQERATDSAYLVLIQGLLPKCLGFLTSVWILQIALVFSLNNNGVWPHHWPIFFQFILMLALSDLVRYWLHRLSHNWKPLWRLHAVHHSPQKVYWMNVGRFHPLEKALQFLVDSLPFLLLGISESVLALYFVFYAVNGFFQHCNLSLRLGFLNYIVSGPELHRWHHSCTTKESNNNYGNNLIIWDLIFGTRFLPKELEVAEIGLRNRNYPTRLSDQLGSPFIKDLDKYDLEEKS